MLAADDSRGGHALLREKFSELLHWESLKRREKAIGTAFFYSLLVSIALVPAQALFPLWLHPFALPLIFLALLAPGFLLLSERNKPLKAISLLDKILDLKARAITSWEILGRKEMKVVELLVLEEAGERLREAYPKKLFPRSPNWPARLSPPLLLLFLFLIWLDIAPRFERGKEPGQPTSLAARLKEFAETVKKRSEAEVLKESLKVAHALAETAEKNLRGQMSEKRLRENLSKMLDKMGDLLPRGTRGSESSWEGATRESLVNLRAELEMLKDSRVSAEAEMRLSTLPRLGEALEKRLAPGEKLDEKDLQDLLAQLDAGIEEELERRTLREIQEFLGLLLKGVEGKGTGLRAKGGEEREQSGGAETEVAQGEKGEGKGSLPGAQPGMKKDAPPSSFAHKSGTAVQLKGLIGEGASRSFSFRRESRGGESKVAEEDVLASYRRQAEEELASEPIPDALKETIKRYFLSLGMGEETK